jgi:quaternary ammonium compound-resistance protein SugE
MTLALRTLIFAAPDIVSGETSTRDNLFLAAVWALALGGLGAVANIFINVLKLIPQQTLSTSDLFEVVGRIILGCLFSVILATTIVASELITFFNKVRGNEIPANSLVLLLPFLAGYSITLVLNLLEKSIRAIEMTIGLDDRRAFAADDQRDTTVRRTVRRPPIAQRGDAMAAWFVLLVGGLLEMTWAIGLKNSDGFSKPVPALVYVSMILSVILLGVGMKGMPVGTAYAVWTGFGAIATAIAGIFCLNEPADGCRLLFLSLILLGIVGLGLLDWKESAQLG